MDSIQTPSLDAYLGYCAYLFHASMHDDFLTSYSPIKCGALPKYTSAIDVPITLAEIA